MIKVMHVITTLGPGGAETMLSRIISGMDGGRFENEVVSLRDVLDLAARLEAMGVRVRTLAMKTSVPNPLLVVRLAQWIREAKPHVIHTWMYHSNLVGTLAARLAGHVPLVWGIRHSALNPCVDKHRTILVDRACAFLSKKIPVRIVCCSEVSRQIHRRLGYAAEKLDIIPNGVDLEQFKPDPTARVSLRRELGIPPGTLLIGIAARFHPHKDHWNFLQAAAQLHRQIPESHFLLCGLNITWQNRQLAGWIQTVGLRDCCHLLGVRRDMSRLFAGVDIATLSSLTEAFPTAIGEAMACGTPCVVTDVGDSALIVDDADRVVAPGDPDALAMAWRKLIEVGPVVRHWLGIAARSRIQQHFALPAVVERYQAMYAQLADGALQGVPARDLSPCAQEIPPA
jgi:glycosyltransferase involved in cell wall biosynthesis